MNLQEILGGPFGQRLAWTLLHFLWQGLVISAGVAAAGRLVSLTRIRGRYAVALAGLVVMACCPLITFIIVQVPAPKAAALAPDVAAAEPQRPGPVRMPLGDMVFGTPPESFARTGEVAAEPPADPVPQTPPAEPGWQARLAAGAAAMQPYMVAVWLAGVVALAVRLLASVLGVHRLARGRLHVAAELAASAARLARRVGLRASPGVFLSPRICEAMLVGLWRPMVLLPAAWIAEMPPDVLEAVIAHELAHVRRFDLWANLLQRLVETLLFYHPAVWWLSRRTSLLREMCADELAVQATGQRMTYASVLELLGRRRLKLPTPQLAAGIGGTRMALLDRVRNVMGVAPGHERLCWWPAGLLALLVPLLLWLVSLGMAQSPPQPTAEEKAASPELPSQPAKTPATVAKGPLPTINHISAAWTARQKRVRSAKLQWKATEFIAKGTRPKLPEFSDRVGASAEKEIEWLPSSDVSLECSQTVFVNSKMLRMDREGPYLHPARGDLEQLFKVCTTDGEAAKLFFDERTIQELCGFIEETARNPEYNGYTYWPIALAFRPCNPDMGGVDLKRCTIDPSLETVDGRVCVVLSAPRLTLWLDPQRDFVVVRVQEELSHRTCDISYREDPSHVWVPLEWTTVVIWPRDGKTRERTVAKVTDYKLNTEIPRSVFQFEFPVGTYVSDLRKEGEGNEAIERYIVRPGGKKRLITKEEIRRGAGADYEELLRTESGKAQGKPARPKAIKPTGTIPAGKAEGQIVFAGVCRNEQGRAIADAQVSLYLDDDGGLSDERLQSIRTDQAAQFRFAPVSQLGDDHTCKSYWVSAVAKGWATVSLGRSALRSRDANRLQIVMSEAASVRGKITGPDGQPVAGAKVWTGLTQGRIDRVNAAMSNAEGLFEISDLEQFDGKPIPVPGQPGAFFPAPIPVLRVRHPNFAGAEADLPRVPGTINVTLQPAAAIEGRVVYGNTEKPAAGVRLFAEAIRINGVFSPSGDAITDFNGRYRFNSLAGGKYNILLAVPKDDYTMGALESFETIAGTTKAASDLRLVHGGLIVGRVIDADTGQPVCPMVGDSSRPYFDVRMYGPSRPLSNGTCESASIQQNGTFQLRAASGNNSVDLRNLTGTVRYLRGVMTSRHEDYWKTVSPSTLHFDVAEGQTVKVEFKVRKRPATETAPSNQQPDSQPATRSSNGTANAQDAPKANDPSGKTTAVKPATDLLREFKEETVFWKQSEIARKLIATGDKRIVPEVAPLLASEDRHKRCNAGWVLAALGDQRGLPVVIAELTDKSDRPTGPERLRNDGTRYVAGQISEDHYYAAWVLERVGDRRAVPALIKALEDPDIDYEAAIALAHLGDQRAVAALLAALERAKRVPPPSVNTNMEIWAAYGLLGLKHPAGLQTLAGFLRSDNQDYRRQAAEAFFEFPDKAAVPFLIRATADKDIGVRVSAITALGKIGDKAAIPTLRAFLADRSKEKGRARLTYDEPPVFKQMTVSEAAAQAIEEIDHHISEVKTQPQADLEPPPGFLILPAYIELAGFERRQRYGINAAQEKELQNIAAAFNAAQEKISEAYKESQKLPPEERKAKLKEFAAEYRQSHNEARTRIENLLTAQQRADYLRDVRYSSALWFSADPRSACMAVGIELTPQQREQFDRLAVESREKYKGNSQRTNERLMAVLTPQQRERLLARFADTDLALSIDLRGYTSGFHGLVTKLAPPPLSFSFLSDRMSGISVYGQLHDPAVRKQLDITADQEAKLQAVLVKSETAAQKIFDRYEPKTAAPKPSHEEQESQKAEYRQALEQFGKQVAAEIEATLQPRQVAALKAIARNTRAAGTLWQHDRVTLDDLHATAEQRAKLWEIYRENAEPDVASFRARGEKALGILTPQQRKKLDDHVARIP